jgi:lambda family phage portal protein
MTRRRETEALDISAEFRRSYEDYRADFDIGGTGRYMPTPRGVQVTGSGADYHYRNEAQFFRAIERARHFDRNNMVVGQGINRLAANLIQDGFTIDVKTGDKKIDADLKAAWYEWCEDPEQCDSEGEKSFYEMEELAARTIPVDGDIFCLPQKENGTLQWLEAHRCRRPASSRSKNCIHGVNLDPSTARRTSYFFTKQDIDPLGSVRTLNDVLSIDARDDDGEKQVLHLHWPRRFSQRRGVTAFAPAALPIQYHDDIQFANLVAAQVQSCYAILEQQLAGMGPNLPAPRTGSEAQTGSRSTEIELDGTTRTKEGMSPGMRIRAKDGYGLTGFTPTIPGPQYTEHALMILTIIAINLDLPVHVLLLDPTKTNFSGWRGAIDEARKRFRVMQRLLISRFYRPVWRWFVRYRIADDVALNAAMDRSGIRLFNHEWRPPTWSYIEPLKDIQADTLEGASSLTSRRRIKARRGEEWDEIAPEIVVDNGLLIREAKKEAAAINKAFPEDDPITWRDVVSLPMPQGVTMALKAEATAENGKTPEAPTGDELPIYAEASE